MVYTQELPKLARLKDLSSGIESFPISGLGIAQQAEHLGYGDDIVGFVELFSESLVFNSRTDFLEHCRLLESLLREEAVAAPERLRSPQD